MTKLISWLRRDWVQIALVWLAWQALLLAAAACITHFEPLGYQPTYALYQVLQDAPLPPFISRLGGFDGVHYQTIIHHRGYREIGGIQAFFPLYPFLMSLFNFLTHQSIVSGLLISSLSLYGFLLLLWRWTREKTDARTAWWLTALMLFLPGSFFYLTVYTESLFLFLLMALFYAYDHKKYSLVAVCGFLLSACRVVGILAVLAVIIDYLFQAWRQQKLTRKTTFCDLFLLSLGSLGLISYMIYLFIAFGDPLMFAHVQAAFGGGRDAAHLVTLPQVFWRYAKMCLVGFSSWTEAYRIWQELLISAAYLVGLVIATWQLTRRRCRLLSVYLVIFSWAAYLLGPATGNFKSMSRYTIVCLAVPILLVTRSRFRGPLLVTFCLTGAVIMIINLLIFLEGILIA